MPDFARATLTAPLKRVGTKLAVVPSDVVEVYSGSETNTIYVVLDHGSGRVRVLATDWAFDRVMTALGCSTTTTSSSTAKKKP